MAQQKTFNTGNIHKKHYAGVKAEFLPRYEQWYSWI